ncbi:MAG: hypothetical protein ACRD07_03335 [Acidimicrobiales bacterium]
MPTTYDLRESLADMPDAARDYIMQLLRLGGDEGRSDETTELPDPDDYGLTEEECQRYVEEAMPRIVQTIGGPTYHVTPPPAGATYQQVVEHYTTQVQQIAGDYYEVSGDGNIVGDGAQGVTGDGSTAAFGEGAQAQSGEGNLLVGDDVSDSVVGQGAQGVASGGGDVGATGFGSGDVTGTTGDGSPAGDVSIGEVEGNLNFGGDQANVDITGVDASTEIEDSFNPDIDDSFNQDNDFVDDSLNQDNDLVDDSFQDNDAVDIA